MEKFLCASLGQMASSTQNGQFLWQLSGAGGGSLTLCWYYAEDDVLLSAQSEGQPAKWIYCEDQESMREWRMLQLESADFTEYRSRAGTYYTTEF